MITDIVVFATIGLGAAFTLAWWLRPGLREWIERPKYEFQDSLRRYDRNTVTPNPPNDGDRYD